jgi:hypothetical protein
MGTKQNPGQFDCYVKALPDEPMFVLLARDPDFFEIVMEWCNRRTRAIELGKCPKSDRWLVAEAMRCAVEGVLWRLDNDGKWRDAKPPVAKPHNLDRWKHRPGADGFYRADVSRETLQVAWETETPRRDLSPVSSGCNDVYNTVYNWCA